MASPMFQISQLFWGSMPPLDSCTFATPKYNPPGNEIQDPPQEFMGCQMSCALPHSIGSFLSCLEGLVVTAVWFLLLPAENSLTRGLAQWFMETAGMMCARTRGQVSHSLDKQWTTHSVCRLWRAILDCMGTPMSFNVLLENNRGQLQI